MHENWSAQRLSMLVAHVGNDGITGLLKGVLAYLVRDPAGRHLGASVLTDYRDDDGLGDDVLDFYGHGDTFLRSGTGSRHAGRGSRVGDRYFTVRGWPTE